MSNKRGFSLLEVILACAVFVIFSVGAVSAILSGLNLNRLGSEYAIATQYAAEGVEAARSIKNQAFANLVNSAGTGVIKSGTVWTFSGTNNVSDKYTRVISIADVNRDGSGNIVASGGTLDAMSKKVTSTVTWNFSPAKNESLTTASYFTNWEAPFGKGGLLAYGDGGTTNDAIKYKTVDASGTWSAASATADVDGATTNKYARAIRVFASATRNEKILLSRHYNGTGQWIYAQVFNGSTWGNVVQLSTWNATTFLDVQNFDGAYLNNGDFVVVYSDNTTTPKFRTWNGSAWGSQTSMNVLTGIPEHIEIEQRPVTNEIMATFLNAANDTQTEYFNGGTYVTANWTTATTHASNTVLNTKRILGFKWSLNTQSTGALVYATATNSKIITGRIFVANGTGGGTWGTAVTSAAQTNNLGAIKITTRPGANEFLACDKDAAATPTIVCRKLTFSGTVGTWTTPTNPIVAAASDTGIQLSFGLNYETGASARALITYSDNTNVPKYKLFTPTTTTIDAAASTLSTTPFTLTSPVRTVKEVTDLNGSTVMTFFTDSAMDLFSSAWSGSFATPIIQHGVAGSAITDYWYDFAFDQF
jgi:prepilin-type N-terminal cleavage/methylation domain-containing protein